MDLWQIFVGASLVFLILEMIIPSMFFLNFAIGALISALCSMFLTDVTGLIVIFVLVSMVSLLGLRPLLIKKNRSDQETGIMAKYVGKTAKVIETVTKNSGVITIYDERWQARSENEIAVGSEVVIERNDSLIMFVKEVK